MIDKSYPIAEKSGSIRDTKENRYLSFLFEILKDWLMNERWKSKCCWKMIMILIWSVEKLIEEGWKSRCCSEMTMILIWSVEKLIEEGGKSKCCWEMIMIMIGRVEECVEFVESIYVNTWRMQVACR